MLAFRPVSISRHLFHVYQSGHPISYLDQIAETDGKTLSLLIDRFYSTVPLRNESDFDLETSKLELAIKRNSRYEASTVCG